MAEEGKINKGDILDPAEVASLQALKKAFDEATASLIIFTTTAGKGADVFKNYQKVKADLTAEEKKAQDIEKESQKLREQTIKAQQGYSEAEKQAIIQKIQNQKAIKEQNDLLKQEAILTDASSGKIEMLKARVAQLILEKKKLQATDIDYTKSVKEINKEIDQHEKALIKLGSATDKQRSKIGDYTQSLTGLPGPIGAVANGFVGLGKQMWALVANPIGAVITLLIGAFTALYKVFAKTDEGAVAIASVFKAIGNVIDVILPRVLSLFKLIGSMITMDFEGMKKNATDAFNGVGKAIGDAAKAGMEYERVMDDIADRESAAAIRMAHLRDEIERLKNVSKDQTKTTQERVKAAEDAMNKEIELNKLEKSFMEERTQAEIKNLAAKINNNKMSISEKTATLSKWLEIDDKELESAQAKDKAFAKFYNENEDAIQKLQKLKSEDILKDAELSTSTRRLQGSLSGFKKELADKEKKDKEDAIKKAKDLEKEKFDFDIKMTTDEVAKKYAILEKSYQDELAIAKKIGKDKAVVDTWYQTEKNKIEAEGQTKSLELQKQNISDKFDEYKKADTEHQVIIQLELDSLLKSYNADLEASKLTEEEKIKLKRDSAKTQRDIDEETNKQIEKAAKDQFNIWDKAFNEKYDIAKKSGGKIDKIEQEMLNAELERTKISIEASNLSADEKIKAIEKVNEFQKKISEDVTKQEEDEAEEKKKRLEDDADAAIDLGDEVLNYTREQKQQEFDDELKDLQKAQKKEDKAIIDENKKQVKNLEKTKDEKLAVLDAEYKTRIAAAAGNAALETQIKQEYESKKKTIEQEFAVSSEQLKINLDTAKEASERKFAIEAAKIARKKAQYEKEQALIDIAINTTLASIKALPNLILSGLIIAAGAAAALTVNNRKLPEIPTFKKGGKTKEDGLAVLHGQELVSLPSGKKFLTPGKIDDPFYAMLPKQTEITSNDILMREIRSMSISATLNKDNKFDDSTILKEIANELKRDKPSLNVNIDETGFHIATLSSRGRVDYINKKFRGRI